MRTGHADTLTLFGLVCAPHPFSRSLTLDIMPRRQDNLASRDMRSYVNARAHTQMARIRGSARQRRHFPRDAKNQAQRAVAVLAEARQHHGCRGCHDHRGPSSSESLLALFLSMPSFLPLVLRIFLCHIPLSVLQHRFLVYRPACHA